MKEYALNKKDAFALSVLVDMMLRNGHATEAADILDNHFSAISITSSAPSFIASSIS